MRLITIVSCDSVAPQADDVMGPALWDKRLAMSGEARRKSWVTGGLGARLGDFRDGKTQLQPPKLVAARSPPAFAFAGPFLLPPPLRLQEPLAFRACELHSVLRFRTCANILSYSVLPEIAIGVGRSNWSLRPTHACVL